MATIGYRFPVSPSTDGHDAWAAAYAATPEREGPFIALSGEEIRPLYTAADLPAPSEIGFPGAFPFTRGIYASMYRGRLWTMRQFAGFGTAVETNERFRYLLSSGQTGLSTAFDMPTLMGHDSDAALSLGEVGREGVAVDTIDDMLDLYAGIELDEVSVSLTINGPAAIVLAFYVAAAGERGVAPERLAGTIQADILKEYIAQKEWCFPVDAAVRLQGDMMEWCTRAMPRWHPVSISGYHIREAGSTAAQELAFTLKNGFTYVEEQLARGIDVDAFAPRLSFFFNAQIDFFEEIAKYRAARRIWARELRERYGARDERSWLMRFHTQTAGASLTAQQPLNNITRTAIEALAGVLGGTQSLHTNSYDEALALPTEESVHRRAAHPADPRRGDRRREHDRPARRQLLRRSADRPCRGAGVRVLRPHRRARRDDRGRQAGLPPARDRRRRIRTPTAHRRRRARRRRRQPPCGGRGARDFDPADRPGARAPPDRAARSRPREARPRRRASALAALREPPRRARKT